MAIPSWPSVTNDTGAYTDGTVWNKALHDSMESALDTQIISVANPGVTAVYAIDSIKAAEGSMASLDARLDVLLNEDGTFKAPATVVTLAQLKAEMGAAINLNKNSTFFLWSAGKTSAPDYYTLANGTITICGTSETDTTRKIGAKCAKITWSSGTSTLVEKILSSGDFGNLDHLKVDTKKIGFGGWVKSSIASHARFQIADGVTTTETDWHSGGGAWEFLGAVHTMSGAATKIDHGFHVASSGSAYVSGMGASFSDQSPTLWVPERVVRGSYMMELPIELTVKDGLKYLHFSRPVRIDNLQMFMVTGPAGASLNIDFEKRESSGWTSMVTAGSIVADGDEIGNMQTTGDYDNRCLSGLFLGSGAAFPSGLDNKLARLNVDQVGSTTAGRDMFLRLDGVQCVHPFEDQVAYDFLGV